MLRLTSLPILFALCLGILASPVSAQEAKTDPAELAKIPGSMYGRTPALREKALRGRGGTAQSEAAVARGLQWLAKNQRPDGSWRLDDPNFRDKGVANDTGGTALALLPFLAAGHTHKVAKDNPHAKTVDKGLSFLLRKQNKKTGDLGGGMYAHGLATMALSEAYAFSKDFKIRQQTQQALNYLVNAQHEGGGWRYAPKQQGDTSVTAWQVQALMTGLQAGLEVPPASLRRTGKFLDTVVGQDEGYGYTDPRSTPSMTAAGLLCRLLTQEWRPDQPRLLKGLEIAEKTGPNAKNIYFSYYATLAMYHRGGDAWTKWNEKMRDHLVNSQEKDPEFVHQGSWFAKGNAFGSAGGQLMQTSLSLLTLEVYYRYTPLSAPKQ
jgi:hypothetical protein